MSYNVNCTPIGLELDITDEKKILRLIKKEAKAITSNKPSNLIECFQCLGFEIIVSKYNKIVFSKLPDKYRHLNLILDMLTPYLTGKIIFVGEDEMVWEESFKDSRRKKVITQLKGKAISEKNVTDTHTNGRKLFLE